MNDSRNLPAIPHDPASGGQNDREIVVTPSGPLTAMQDRFVDELVANGGRRAEAAIEAGYSSASAKSIAWRICQKDVVAAEIYRRTRLRLAEIAPRALRGLEELAMTASSERVRREALSDLLDRVGLAEPQRIEHNLAGGIKVSIDLSD